ncbi:neurexin-3, partial [Nephila pilipes]
FQGAVKDVVFTSDDGIQKAQELQESQGIRTASLHPQLTPNGEEVLSADDHCEKDNPCLNGGACISTDGGPICDCRATDYEGDLCEQMNFNLDPKKRRKDVTYQMPSSYSTIGCHWLLLQKAKVGAVDPVKGTELDMMSEIILVVGRMRMA